MLTNELRKGDRVLLNNGWYATVMDNAKGNTRMCNVEGFFTEMGSVYSHDIAYKVNSDGTMTKMEYTPNQLKVKKMAQSMGF